VPASKMHKRQESIDDASKALLDEFTERGDRKEQRSSKDDPFLDEEGDLKVVPTLEALSDLVDPESSVNAIPMVEILRRSLRVSLRATEMAEIAYHANPRQGQATALTQMQTTTRDLMKAIEEHQDPDAFAEELIELVIKPMIFEFIKILTSEADRTRAALLTIIPPETANVVRHEMEELMKGMKAGMDEAYDESKRKLADLLGAKAAKRAK